jgi:hypothetical protein
MWYHLVNVSKWMLTSHKDLGNIFLLSSSPPPTTPSTLCALKYFHSKNWPAVWKFSKMDPLNPLDLLPLKTHVELSFLHGCNWFGKVTSLLLSHLKFKFLYKDIIPNSKKLLAYFIYNIHLQCFKIPSVTLLMSPFLYCLVIASLLFVLIWFAIMCIIMVNKWL